jgi:hypothetical protein
VANNTVSDVAFGAGIANNIGYLSLLNTIVYNPNSGAAFDADNWGPVNQAQNCLFGSTPPSFIVTNLGGNLFHTNPLLGPLQNYGGPTPTMVLLFGSPALGAGAGTSQVFGLSVPTSDQRGAPRPATSIDIGAYQSQPQPPSLPPPYRFVQALYHDFMGREATQAELQKWVNLLPTLGQSRVASDIIGSPEALTYTVDQLYFKLLGRQAVGGEEMGWVHMLEQGATEEQVIAGILGGQEFAKHAKALVGGSNANANYVQALYEVLLGRHGSSSEVAAGVQALPSLGRQGVAGLFVYSREFRADLVRQFYGPPTAPAGSVVSEFPDLLDRTTGPTVAEVNGWVRSGLGILAIEGSLASGKEYYQNG